MRIMAYLGVLVVGIGILFALRTGMKFYRSEADDYVRHAPSSLALHPELAGIDGLREVRFEDASGTRLAGWYAPSRNRAAVVLVHGTGADRAAVLGETKFLAAAGFGVLAIDAPGQGLSGGETQWGVAERRAISAAVDWLSTQEDVDKNRIGGLGFSMGAYVMAQAGALDQRLRAVVLVGSPNEIREQNWVSSGQWWLLSQVPSDWALRASAQSFDMPAREVVGKIAPRPLLIIGGANDTIVPQYMAQQLFAAAREPKELWIVPGAEHTDILQTAPREYPARVSEFLKRYLADPG